MPPPITRVLLCRHGETDWNRERRYQGQQDTPLNDRGREQSRLLGKTLSNININAVYSSPLQRSMETARIVLAERAAAGRPPVELRPDPAMKEISHGVGEGKLTTDVERDHPQVYRNWIEAPHTVRWPDGESLEDVAARAVPALERIIRQNQNRTVLIVAHGGVNKALLLRVLGAPLSRFWTFRQDSACLNIADVRVDSSGALRPEIIAINNVAHTGKLCADFEPPEV